MSSNLRPRRKYGRNSGIYVTFLPNEIATRPTLLCYRRVEVATRPLQIYNLMGHGFNLVRVGCESCVVIVVRVWRPKAVLPPVHP